MDRAKWRAWTQEQSQRHERCGTFEWETWKGHPDYKGPVWEAGSNLCHGCYELDLEMERVQADLKRTDKPSYGLSVGLFRSG